MTLKYTEEQLNKIDKDELVSLVLSLQEEIVSNTGEIENLNKKMQLVLEQLTLSNKARFGRSSEKMNIDGQIAFMEANGEIIFFNEAEAHADPCKPEPVIVHEYKRGIKKKGKRDEDMKGLKTNTVPHYLTEEELERMFGVNGWRQLPDEIARKYLFIPAQVEVDEHHIGVYQDKKTGDIIRAPHPKWLLKASPVSPTLAAGIMNAKYVNAVPLARQEKEFERYGVKISRANMANWMIRLADEYFGIMYDFLHSKLYDYHVIQADETPVLVNRDGRPAGAKSYMWVYRSGHMYKDKQIVLYEYQKTRNASHPREFLKNYKGICLTDGYQVYHTIEKQLPDLKIAGCYVHMRRKFIEALDVVPKAAQKASAAYPAIKMIQAIYREEGKLKDSSSEDRLIQRQAVVKPLVDAFFEYVKTIKAADGGKLHQAVTYALNQEPYLRVFLEDGDVPIDNNASEQAIRGFCVGKKNWEVIDTVNGAKSSAIIYSIAETAKANNLKPYEYFRYLLEVIPEHADDTDRSFLDKLLPWSPELPESIRKH